MYLPRWFWRVRFRSADGGGETFVVAPHRAAAKQAIATPPEHVTAYESAEPYEKISQAMAGQRFEGYYPILQAAITGVTK